MTGEFVAESENVIADNLSVFTEVGNHNASFDAVQIGRNVEDFILCWIIDRY